MDCLKKPRYSILMVNLEVIFLLEELGKVILYPCSSLFLLVSEVLGALLIKLAANRHYEGFLVGKEEVHIFFFRVLKMTFIEKE